MTPRPSRPGDEPGLRRLWQAVFDDGDALLDAFFSLVYRPGSAAVIEEEGQIVSAAYAVTLQNALYIYAVATLPAFRGRGFGEAVTLAAAGGRPAYLYPAEPGLRAWYAGRMGAVTLSYRPPWRADAPLRPISPGEYGEARERLLSGIPHAVYPLPLLRFFQATGGGFFACAGGVCALDGDTVKEALPCDTTEGEPFIMGLNGAAPLYWGLVFD